MELSRCRLHSIGFLELCNHTTMRERRRAALADISDIFSNNRRGVGVRETLCCGAQLGCCCVTFRLSNSSLLARNSRLTPTLGTSTRCNTRQSTTFVKNSRLSAETCIASENHKTISATCHKKSSPRTPHRAEYFRPPPPAHESLPPADTHDRWEAHNLLEKPGPTQYFPSSRRLFFCLCKKRQQQQRRQQQRSRARSPNIRCLCNNSVGTLSRRSLGVAPQASPLLFIVSAKEARAQLRKQQKKI